MELRDNLWLVICIFVPTIYCGKLTEYLRLKYFQNRHRWQPEQTVWPQMITMVRPLTFLLNRSCTVYSNDAFEQAERRVNKRSLLAWLQLAVIHRDMHRDIFTTLPYTRSYTTDIHSPTDLTKRHYMKHIDTNIELLLVIDNSTFKKFMRENMFDIEEAKRKIKQYFSIIIAMVNQRFETITDKTFSIHVQICDMFVAETKREIVWLEYISRWSPYNGNSIVSASRALKRFQKWLRRNKSLPNYDHAILLTSYMLRRKLKRVDGLAYVNTMCDTTAGKSASIVQDIGDFQSAGVITHELGHSLGATHDGDGTNNVCPANRNNIMAPQNSQDQGVSKNVFFFSQCSTRQLKHYIMSPKANCLSNVAAAMISHDLVKTPPGQIFDEHDQCKMAFGGSTMFCEHESARSSVCSRLWCTSPAENKCHSNNRLMALPGTPCGGRKFCHLGECVSPYRQIMVSNFRNVLYNEIPRRDDDCTDFNDHYCSVIIRASSYLCEERPSMKDDCCKSCIELVH